MEEFSNKDLDIEINFEENMLKDCGNGLLLTDIQMNILTRYNIDYKQYSSVSQLLYIIEDYLNEDSFFVDGENDDLEWIANELAERNYYMNTNK